MQHIIAIDIGTTHIKASIVNERAEVLFSLLNDVDTIKNIEGVYEQDAERIFQSFISLLKNCLKEINENDIACISFSAAMHSILAIDKNNNPLTNAITWADTRAAKQAAALRNTSIGNDIYLHTGTPIHAMSPLCKLLWIKDEMPSVFAKAARFISIKEYIFYRLFGKYIIDEGIASATGLYDFENKKWYAPALSLCSINENHLSTIVQATHAETEMIQTIKDELSLQKNIPFIIGGSDGGLANIGCGALQKDTAVITLGTSGAARVSLHASEKFNGNGLFRYAVVDDLHICGGPVNNGGIVLQWFAENFLSEEEKGDNFFNAVMFMAQQSVAGSNGLIFLPYLLGERAPVWNENASGVFFNINITHNKNDFARAVVEGISFSLFHVLQTMDEAGIQTDRVMATGIITKNEWWMQLFADICGRPVSLTGTEDASSMGAAYLGMYAMRIIKNFDDINVFNQSIKTFIPNKNNYTLYQKTFAKYKSLYTKLADEFV